jgi:drug/metabolite transporter (DMT)-like permease
MQRPSNPTSAHHPLRGALLCMAAVLLFACMDTTTKYLTARYDVPFIMAVRYLGNLLLMALLLGPSHGRAMVESRRTGLVLVRAVCLASASLFFGLALQHLPVAETTAINFLAPVAVVIAAGRLLDEKSGWAGPSAAVLGFAGVLLIARPGGGLDPLGLALALCAAASNAAYQLLSRVLAATERTVALLFYTALAGSILFGLAAPWFMPTHAMSLHDTLLLASLGVYGGVGHFLFTAAFRQAPASLIAPLGYAQLVWAGLLGWLVFGHVPDPLSLSGMAIIAASGVLAAVKSRAPPTKRSA